MARRDETDDRVLALSRVFDAPRELLFDMWTDSEHCRHWMAPKDFTAPVCEGELRVGGAWRMSMRPASGPDHWLGGVYREIVRPERLVFTHVWYEADGKTPAPGQETVVTVTFAEEKGKTRVTMLQALFSSVEERDGHGGGWSECFDLLDAYLARIRRAA